MSCIAGQSKVGRGNPGGSRQLRPFSVHSKLELCKRGEEEQYKSKFIELEDVKSIACLVAELNAQPARYPDNAYLAFSNQGGAFFVVYRPGGLQDIRQKNQGCSQTQILHGARWQRRH